MSRIDNLVRNSGLPDALLSGNGGYLRRSVTVEPGDDVWSIRHSLWEITLPASVLGQDTELRSLFERKLSLSQLGELEERVANFLLLLLHQGCFTLDASATGLDATAIRYVLQAAVNGWYRAYYAHPLWARLRNETLTLPQVFLWAFRTYHLSRSAGPTAARGAANPVFPGISEVFFKSCLEEFSHCDDFYFPEHREFGLGAREIEDLIPLAASTAFDQQMLRIAERDPLAHLTVAYFQEFTAEFRKNAFELYDHLESRYKLNGFFQGWKDHVGYDLDHSHSDDLFDALTGDELFSPAHVIRSLDEAGKTVDDLMWALDQISLLPTDTYINAVRPRLSKFIELVTRKLTLSEDAKSIDELATSIAEVLKAENSLDRPIRNAYFAMKCEVLQAIFLRALGFSQSHQEVVLLGRAVESLTSETSTQVIDPLDGGGEPVLNFLWESSRKPLELAIALQTAAHYMNSRGSLDEALAWSRLLTSPLSMRVPSTLGSHLIRDVVGLSYQLIELMQSDRSHTRLPKMDIFDASTVNTAATASQAMVEA